MWTNKLPAPQHFLFERMVYGHCRTRHHVLIIDIGRDPDNAPRRGADLDEFHHRIGPHDVSVHGILIREHPLRKALAYDHDRLAIFSIRLVEIAAGNDRDTERREEARGHGAESRARIFFAWLRGRGLRLRTGIRGRSARFAPRNEVPSATRSTPGSCVMRRDRFLVETEDLFRRTSVRDHRDIQREHMVRIEAGLRRLQREQRLQQHARAGQQDERRGNLGHREHSKPPARAAGDPQAAARQAEAVRRVGRRQARDKRQQHRGHERQPTPTHSRLESTVRSSARTEKRDAYRARIATIGRAISTPENAPAPQSSRLSASSVRRSAPVLAPSAARIASSPSRRTDRARIRFATFEQAMMKISADAASSTSSTVRARDVIWSRSRTASIRKSAFGGYDSGCSFTIAPWTVRSSARAASRVAPGASRPNSSVIRWTRPGHHRRRKMMRAGDDVGDDFGFRRIRHRRLQHADDRGRARSPSRTVLPITDGSLFSAVVQKRYVSTAAPAAFGPSSRMVEQSAEHRTQTHHVEVRAADDAGAHLARLAEADHREADGREVAECAERFHALAAGPGSPAPRRSHCPCRCPARSAGYRSAGPRRGSPAAAAARRGPRVKMAALAPMPSASVRTTVIERPLVRASDRNANFTSRKNAVTDSRKFKGVGLSSS